MKAVKLLLGMFLALFSVFIVIGIVMYGVYYVYTNYKREVIDFFKKYPEIAHILRKIASVTSEVVSEDEIMSAPETVLLPVAPKKKPNKVVKANKVNARQDKILDLLRAKEKIEVAQLKENFPKLNVRTLRRDFTRLENLGLVMKVGKTKGSYYRLR